MAYITGGSALNLFCPHSYPFLCDFSTWGEGFPFQKCNMLTKMHFSALLSIICLCLLWPLPHHNHHEEFLRIGLDWILFLTLCQLWSFSNKSQPINDHFVKKPRENFPSEHTNETTHKGQNIHSCTFMNVRQ